MDIVERILKTHYFLFTSSSSLCDLHVLFIWFWPSADLFLGKKWIIFSIYFISESTNDLEAGDGWDNDDDADWGSLEETKNSVKSQLAPNSNSNNDNDITKEEIDSWATDLLSNKVPDKSAVVKQGIQTLQLVNHYIDNF